MPKRRTLKDAAMDPTAKKETAVQKEQNSPGKGITFALSVVAAVAAGFIAGYLTKKWVRFI